MPPGGKAELHQEGRAGDEALLVHAPNDQLPILLEVPGDGQDPATLGLVDLLRHLLHALLLEGLDLCSVSQGSSLPPTPDPAPCPGLRV